MGYWDRGIMSFISGEQGNTINVKKIAFGNNTTGQKMGVSVY